MDKFKLDYGITLRDTDTHRVFLVAHYWIEDTDPMAYKVTLLGESMTKLYSWNAKGDSYYSSDLVSLVKKGKFEQVIWDESQPNGWVAK